MDFTYFFDITAIVLFFAITAFIACVLAIGISIYIFFWNNTPFHSSIKVFIVIAYGVYITFTVLAFVFLEVVRKQYRTR